MGCSTDWHMALRFKISLHLIPGWPQGTKVSDTSVPTSLTYTMSKQPVTFWSGWTQMTIFYCERNSVIFQIFLVHWWEQNMIGRKDEKGEQNKIAYMSVKDSTQSANLTPKIVRSLEKEITTISRLEFSHWWKKTQPDSQVDFGEVTHPRNV